MNEVPDPLRESAEVGEGKPMEMKESDFLDRFTILRMKARFDDAAKRELVQYTQELERMVETERWKVLPTVIISAIVQLAEANGKIWLTEAAIRKEFPNDPSAGTELDLSEIGKRALEIRDYNKLRVEAKKAIDRAFDQIPENKVDHASQ